jgi:hypothetical protein
MVIAHVCQPLAASRPKCVVRRRFVGEVEGLGIIFAREVEHFLARDFILAEAALHADLDIIEIEHGMGFG